MISKGKLGDVVHLYIVTFPVCCQHDPKSLWSYIGSPPFDNVMAHEKFEICDKVAPQSKFPCGPLDLNSWVHPN